MSGKDFYYNKAKQEGYRSRAAYKLIQLDEAAGLLAAGATVVDLGAAPGGWLQVAAERVGPGGTVVGVDRQRIEPLEDVAARVERVRGDVTDEETRQRVIDLLGAADENTAGGPVDVVLSDMAPNVTGEYNVDHARSVHLARQAFETAEALLATGGDLVVKVFDGPDVEALRADMEATFEHVRTERPDASRDSSSELYLVGKRYLTAPVAPGETHEVEIVDVGSEGDGVARIDGFAVFVPGTTEGETVEIRIEDVKARYAFAERIE